MLDDADEAFEGFFRTFPRVTKGAWARWLIHAELVPESPRTRAQPPRESPTTSSTWSTGISRGRASGTRLHSGTAGGWSTMMGSCWVLEFGGHRGSSCWGGDVPVIMQYRFKQSVPIDSGSASPSVHRENFEHHSHVTETGTHSAKLRRRSS